MATVKEKPQSQAQIDRERSARKTYRAKKKAERQAAQDATILSRAAAAVKAPKPAPKSQKRQSVAPKPAPKAKPSVAPAVDSQQIAGFRAQVEQLQAEIERLHGVILSQNENFSKLIEEKNAVEKILQNHMDYFRANNGCWVLIQVED